jgi:hypothetical protein
MITLIVLTIIIGIFLMIFLNVSVYYYIFHHKAYRIWKDAYTNAVNCDLKWDLGWCSRYRYKKYTVMLWHDSKVASIHIPGVRCVVSTFDTKRSKKLYKAIQDSRHKCNTIQTPL